MILKKPGSNRVVIYNLMSTFILNGINFIITPIFTRLLGPENYGLFSLYLTWQSLAVIFIGLQTQAIIGNISSIYSKKEREQFFSSTLIINTIIVLIMLVLFLFYRIPISKFLGFPTVIIIFLLVHAYANHGVNIMTGIWSFDKKADKYFYFSLINAISNILGSYFLITLVGDKSNGYVGRIVGSSIFTVITGFYFIIRIYLKGKTEVKKEYWSYGLHFSIPLVFHALSSIILNQSDRVMLQKMVSINSVGVYSIVYTLTNILTLLWQAFNSAWVPFYYEDMKKGNIDLVLKKSKNYIILFCELVIGFLLVAPEVYIIFGGKEFKEGIFVIPYLALSCFFVFLYSFSVNFKYYKANTKSIAVGTVCSGIINILFNFLLIPFQGIRGAALATMISYIMLFIFHEMGAEHLGKEEYSFQMSYFFKPIVIVGIIAIISYTVLMNHPIVRWGMAIIDGIILMYGLIRRKGIW